MDVDNRASFHHRLSIIIDVQNEALAGPRAAKWYEIGHSSCIILCDKIRTKTSLILLSQLSPMDYIYYAIRCGFWLKIVIFGGFLWWNSSWSAILTQFEDQHSGADASCTVTGQTWESIPCSTNQHLHFKCWHLVDISFLLEDPFNV